MPIARTNFGVPIGATPRTTRRPEHTFNIKHSPMAITPFAIAPVLPGETLTSAMWQARAVTDPIKHPLIGWWLEHMLFYVKLTDLTGYGPNMQNMLVNPTYVVPSGNVVEAAQVDWYHGGGLGSQAIPFTRECVRAIVTGYFRDENDAASDFMIGNYFAAKVKNTSWLDSASTTVEYGGQDLNLDLNADGIIKAQETEQAMRQWQMQRLHGLTELTYEEYLRQAGVKVDEDVINKPELIRMASSWQYPVNTVDPLTGTPSSAVSWSITERADKDRYFTEPGFIVGVTVARPKVYLSKQTASLVEQMNNAYAWLPPALRTDFEHSFKKLVKTWGVVSGQTDDMWIDMRDLFIYGDQFVNYALTGSTTNQVGLPSPALQKKYPTLAEMDALFVSAPKTKVQQDGILHLYIKSSVKDVSPTT